MVLVQTFTVQFLVETSGYFSMVQCCQQCQIGRVFDQGVLAVLFAVRALGCVGTLTGSCTHSAVLGISF